MKPRMAISVVVVVLLAVAGIVFAVFWSWWRPTEKMFEGDITLDGEHVHVKQLSTHDRIYVGEYSEGWGDARYDTILTYPTGKRVKLTTQWEPTAIWKFVGKTYVYHSHGFGGFPIALYKMNDSGDLLAVSIRDVPPGQKEWNLSDKGDVGGGWQREFDEAYESASRPAGIGLPSSAPTTLPAPPTTQPAT